MSYTLLSALFAKLQKIETGSFFVQKFTFFILESLMLNLSFSWLFFYLRDIFSLKNYFLIFLYFARDV